MRRIIQISGWLLFIMGLIIIMDMDPSMTTLPQGNGNREIIKMLIYFILIIVQIALYFLSVARTGRIFSACGILLLLIIAWSSEQ